jgi:hypothetical protein
MAAIKLKPGETVIVAAVDPSLVIGGGPMPGGGPPVDPGYGIDLGLGYLRPTHPIAPGGSPGTPTHPIVLPPEGPVDPLWGIDEDIGYLRPDNTLPVPPPTGGVKPTVNWEIKTAWTPVSGWVVVAVPTGEHVTPSTAPRRA